MIELSELTDLPGAVPLAAGVTAFRGVTTDSRQVASGSLFVALRGDRDGHEYVAAAIGRGAAGALVERPVDVPDGTAVVQVPDSLAALQALGRAARSKLGGHVVSVTGSVGKTTTKNLIQHVLARHLDVAASEKSFNNHLGVPLTLLRIAEEAPGAPEVVTEVGTNSPGEIAHLGAILRPDLALVTNVGFAHVGNFGSRADLAAEKVSLYDCVPPEGTWVVNADDPLVAEALRGRLRPARVVTVGLTSDAELRAVDLVVDQHGTAGRLEADGESVDFRIPLVGRHFASTVLFAAAVARERGLTLAQVAEGVATFPASEGRAAITTLGGLTLVDDSYNGSPDATLAALDTLATVPGTAKVAVLGEMRELGDWSERLHAEVAAKVGAVATHLVAVGSNAGEVRRVAVEHGLPSDQAWTARSATEAGELLQQQHLGEDAAVLVKGSRFTHMERVALMLAGEQVGCPLDVCTLYIHCRTCPHLHTGPPEGTTP